MSIERRFVPAEDLELRVEKRDDGKRVLTGYPIVYNSPSLNLGGFREVVAPGACDASIGSDDIRGLINHDTNLLLGRNRAGTMRLVSDTKGVRMEIDLPDTQPARDLAVSIERGDMSGGSFSFRVTPGGAEWTEPDDELPLRTLRSVKLFDVGPVTFPAYPQTDMAVRSHVEDAVRELEELRAARARSWERAAAARERELQLQS